MLLDHSFESLLAGTLHLVNGFTILDNDESRHALDAELLAEFTLIVNVYLQEDHLSVVLLSQLLINGLDHLAWRAPDCSEVNQDGERAGLGNLLHVVLGAGDHNCVMLLGHFNKLVLNKL